MESQIIARVNGITTTPLIELVINENSSEDVFTHKRVLELINRRNANRTQILIYVCQT